MDRELHRAHGQSEHRNGACEDPMTLNWDDTNQQGTHVVEFSVQLCTQRLGKNRFTDREAIRRV